MSAETIELTSPPSLPRLYAQAVLVPIIRGGDGELPDRRLMLRGAAVDADRVANYCQVCGFGVRSTAPGTYPHVLAFPLHLCLMADRAFPLSVLGLVHIANRIEVLAPIPLGANLDLFLHAEDLRAHPRGQQFDLVAEWRVPRDIGRRYAAVSGDRNPIHMHALSARLLGFPAAIAHGMWTKARCLAAFEGRIPDAFVIEAEFKSPLLIPGRARFLSGQRGDGWRFRVESPDGERKHVIGSIS
jgi:hypothetical protein